MKKESKKQKLEKGEEDFADFEDLGDLESDIDFGGDLDTSSRKTSVRDIAADLSKDAGKGFFTTLARKGAEKALPESYTENQYAAIDYADFTKETIDTNKTKIDRSIYKLGKEIKKIIPFQSSILENFLAKYEADFEEFKQQSVDQQREASVASELGSLFDKQLDIQKAFESKRSAEDEVESKQRMATDKLNMDVLTSIDSHVGTQSAFTLQISKEYYRKSLELQYKTYFIQADMLKDMRDYYKGFSKQFEDIALNTSLPDFVKLNTVEAMKHTMREQFTQNAYKQVFSNSEYVANVKKKLAGLISNKVGSITEGADNLTEALSGVNQAGEFGGGGGKVLGSVLSGLGGSTLGGKIAKRIPERYLEKVKNNKTIQTGGNLLSMLANSPRTLFASLRNRTAKGKEDYQDNSGILRTIIGKLYGGADELLSVTDPGIKQFGVSKASILDHSKPALFDNKVHRSISEVIPMYLAKILSENTNLREMYRTVNSKKLGSFKAKEELVYDYESRNLTTHSAFRLATEKSVLKDVNRSGKKITDVASSISHLGVASAEKAGDKDDADFLKSKAGKKSFSEFMTAASEKLTPEEYNYENLISNYDKNPTLRDMVGKNEVLAKYLAILQKNDLSKKHVNLNEKVLDTRRIYPTLGIIELFKGTSKIVGSKTLNNPSGEVANKIAEGLSRYISISNSVVTMDTIINGQCFKMMTEKDLDLSLTNIKIFIGQCKSINAASDYLMESSFEVLLGVMNESLLNNFEVDPAVFQKLYDYSPILHEDGKLTTRNLVEGKLGREDEDKEFASDSTIKSLSRVRGGSLKQLAQDKAKTTIVEQIENSGFYKELTKFTDIATEFSTNLGKAEGIKEISASVRKMFGDVVKQSQESGKKFYVAAEKEFTDGLSKVNSAIENISEKSAPEVKNLMLSTVTKTHAKIELLIKTEEESLRVMESQLTEISKTLEGNIDDPSLLGKSKLSLRASLNAKKIEIKLLKKFKGNLQAAVNRISNIDPKGVNVGDLLKSAFETLNALKTEAKETLDMFEEEAKAQADAATST